MAVQKGERIENFILPDSEGAITSLSNLIKEKRILLLFFPLAFSEVCTDMLSTVRNNMKLYNALRTSVAAISVDSFYVLREFKKANNYNFTLLSDFNKEVSRRFGCLNVEYQGMKGVSKKAAFIINKEFRIEYAEVLDNAEDRPNFKSIQKILAQ